MVVGHVYRVTAPSHAVLKSGSRDKLLTHIPDVSWALKLTWL